MVSRRSVAAIAFIAFGWFMWVGPARAQAALSPSTPFGSARFVLVPAETVDSYEVGFKGSFFDRTLRLGGALYHYKYENFQTILQVGTTFITSNAGEASATGVEMQGVWSPTDNFSFFGTYPYNNGRFEGGAYDGNRFRLSPDHAFSLGMDVQWPFIGGEVYFRPTYTWQSKVFFDDNNDEAFFQQAPPKFVADNIIDEFQESYGLLNARLLAEWWRGVPKSRIHPHSPETREQAAFVRAWAEPDAPA